MEVIDDDANSSTYAEASTEATFENPWLVVNYTTDPPIPWRLFRGLRKSSGEAIELTEAQEKNVVKAMARVSQGQGNIEDSLPFVSALIDKHASELRNWSNRRGATFLILAIMTGHKEMVKSCLELRADPNSTMFLSCTDEQAQPAMTRHGYTPLFLAVICQQYEIAQMLYDVGGSVNVSDRWGRTPLHAACAFDDEEAIKFLLKHHAYRERFDRDHARPGETSIGHRHPAIRRPHPLLRTNRTCILTDQKQCRCNDCLHEQWYVNRATRNLWLPTNYVTWMSEAVEAVAAKQQAQSVEGETEEQAPSPAAVVGGSS